MSQGLLSASVKLLHLPWLSRNWVCVNNRRLTHWWYRWKKGKAKSKCSANTILGVTLVVSEAGAVEKGLPRYLHVADLADHSEVTLVASVGWVGSSHCHLVGNKMAMQEFKVPPIGATNFREVMRIGAEIYDNLKNIFKNKYVKDATSLGAEGSCVPGE